MASTLDSRLTPSSLSHRDGIQFVHDQTLRYINKGYDVDRVVSLVKLPPALAEHPYLLEFYGSVDWSVRAVFSHYLGCSQSRTPYTHLRYASQIVLRWEMIGLKLLVSLCSQLVSQ